VHWVGTTNDTQWRNDERNRVVRRRRHLARIIVLVVRVAATPSFGRRDPQCRGKPAGRNDVFTYYIIIIIIILILYIFCVCTYGERVCVCSALSVLPLPPFDGRTRTRKKIVFNLKRSPPDDSEGHRGSYNCVLHCT